jgi:hypothetical protein
MAECDVGKIPEHVDRVRTVEPIHLVLDAQRTCGQDLLTALEAHVLAQPLNEGKHDSLTKGVHGRPIGLA